MADAIASSSLVIKERLSMAAQHTWRLQRPQGARDI
jgi:hypothetical protein